MCGVVDHSRWRYHSAPCPCAGCVVEWQCAICDGVRWWCLLLGPTLNLMIWKMEMDTHMVQHAHVFPINRCVGKIKETFSIIVNWLHSWMNVCVVCPTNWRWIESTGKIHSIVFVWQIVDLDFCGWLLLLILLVTRNWLVVRSIVLYNVIRTVHSKNSIVRSAHSISMWWRECLQCIIIISLQKVEL